MSDGSPATARVRAVVLNYNGGRHVERCVEALLATDWPAGHLEVVVVDNASADGSDRALVERFGDRIELRQTGANLGFPANNVALADLDGVDYVALVNNDAFVDPGWLAPLVAALDDDPGLGAACPRILFAPAFHTLEIETAAHHVPGDGRDLGLQVWSIRVGDDERLALAQGARHVWGVERNEQGAFRWVGASSLMRLPVDAGEVTFGVAELEVSAPEPKHVTFTCGDWRVHAEVGPERSTVRVPYSGRGYDVVNNAGSVLIDDGSGGDRGFCEMDAGQFDQPVEVFNWCGGGVLLRPRYLAEVGLFDERFFLYYEDTDLSWRGQAQGWRYRYVPDSLIRHLHGASAGEGSDLFHHFVERNRLLMLLKNAPPRLAVEAPARYLLATASYARRDVVAPLLAGERPRPHETLRRLRSFAAYVEHAPAMLADRRRLRHRQVVDDDALTARFLPRSQWGVPTPVPRPAASDAAATTGTDTDIGAARRRGDGRPTVAVYDRWWSTAGGGEKFAGGIAQVLSEPYAVTLLTHEAVDLDDLGERLQLDLSHVRTRRIDLAPDAVTEASADYDLLVNASYTSTAANAAGRGLYVVHFPTPPTTGAAGVRGRVARALQPVVAEAGHEVRWARGFHPIERVGRHKAQWTTGDAELEVLAPAGRRLPLELTFGNFLGYGLPVTPVEVWVDGERRCSVDVAPQANRFGEPLVTAATEVVGRGDDPVRVTLHSATHVPSQVFGTGDTRRLGVPLVAVRLGGGPRAAARARYRSLDPAPVSMQWLETYHAVVANSVYTRTWIERWWGCEAGLLNPPVTLQPARAKERIILNVGRFFAAEHGHSKKQLELVEGFGMLWDRGLRDWELHLVGGCSDADRPYLDRVRAAAEGLPVVLHVGAPGAELRDLYGRASIYWHASGLGEDDQRHPDRFEHFGITTVEAMSAGAVPVVIGKAGQLEVLRHGVEGFHWQSLSGLCHYTALLASDPEHLARMGAAASRRAEGYGMDAFGGRVCALAADLLAAPSRAGSVPGRA